MNKRMLLIMVLSCFAAVADGMNDTKAAMERVCKFIKDAKVYYIATVEGDQPRVRPFGTVNIFEGKLYIQTGRKKNVGKQLAANGKVEICALNGSEWLRVTGTVVDDTRIEPQVAMLEAYPNLKSMYKPGDGNTMVLYFKDATAAFYSMSGDMNKPDICKF